MGDLQPQVWNCSCRWHLVGKREDKGKKLLTRERWRGYKLDLRALKLNPIIRQEKPFFEWLVRAVQVTPKQYKLLIQALVAFSGLQSGPLLLITQNTSYTGLR